MVRESRSMVAWDNGNETEKDRGNELQSNIGKLLGVMNIFTVFLVIDS